MGKGKLFKANYLLLYGAGIKMVSDGLFSLVTPDRLTLALGAGFLSMFGMGMLLVAVIVAVQLSCLDENIGLASLVLGSVRSTGGSLAVTLYTNIMQNTLKQDAGPAIAKAVLPLGVPKESLGSLTNLLIGDRPKDALKLPGLTQQAITVGGTALKWVWSLAFQ